MESFPSTRTVPLAAHWQTQLSRPSAVEGCATRTGLRTVNFCWWCSLLVTLTLSAVAWCTIASPSFLPASSRHLGYQEEATTTALPPLPASRRLAAVDRAPRHIYIDGGANWGDTTDLFTVLAEPPHDTARNWEVYSFECFPKMVPHLHQLLQWKNGQRTHTTHSRLTGTGA